MNNSTIIKSVFFAASRETVWSFLTEKDKLALWFHPTESDLCINEPYAFVRQNEHGENVRQIWGRVLELEAPSKLTYTFIIDAFNGAETTVSWLLEEVAGGTRLSLAHEGIAQAAEPAALQLLLALDQGWNKHLADLHSVTD